MTGYTENELISSGRDITHPGDRAEQSRLLPRILPGELAAASVEEPTCTSRDIPFTFF